MTNAELSSIGKSRAGLDLNALRHRGRDGAAVFVAKQARGVAHA